MEHKFPEISIPSTLVEGPRHVRLTNGQSTAVTQTSVPLGLKLHTAWGAVEIQPQVFAVLLGDDVVIIGRNTLEILGISPNAELDRIAPSKFEPSASAYGWREGREISVMSPMEYLAMARSLESDKVIPHDVRTPEHLHSKAEQQAGCRVATEMDW